MNDVGADVNGEKDEKPSEKCEMRSERDEIAVRTDEAFCIGRGLTEQQ